MRGEDCARRCKPWPTAGSPPHARGRRFRMGRGTFPRGITPACAGKTCRLGRRGTGRPDHPRMRGEDLIHDKSLSYATGSPPHARGRRLLIDGVENDVGITPACAGKTLRLAHQRLVEGDHPRMRGEDGPGRWVYTHGEGSPPHARGRPACSGHTLKSCRITPACAGKTVTTERRRPKMRDHPRMRGEDCGSKP